jgi:hypothetical protein
MKGAIMAPAPGTHPTAGHAVQIVMQAVAPDFPQATQNDTVGGLYPLQSQRFIFVARVVQNALNLGFHMPAGQVPVGDNDTLAAVVGAVVTNAVA